MDENKIIQVKIAASKPFVFSWKYSEKEIIESLTEAMVLFRTVKDLPIIPSLAAQLEEELIRRSIFGTAALEGNPLSEEKVAEIISKSDKEKIREKSEQEIINLKVAYEIIKETEPANSPPILDEELINRTHEFLTCNINYEYNTPGRYRNSKVQVGDRSHGGVYTPPKEGQPGDHGPP